MGLQAAQATLGGKVRCASSAEECARSADVLVIATAWPQFAELPASVFANREERAVVIDPWRILAPGRYAEVADVVHLGRGPAVAPARGVRGS
jgi:predicted dinucleotide-binding enzyme